MSGLLRRLEGLGFIRREHRNRPRRSPGRHPLYLTESGTTAYWRGRQCLVTEAKHIFSKLDRDQKRTLIALLAKITSLE